METHELRKLFVNAINERYDLINALENILKWSAHFPPAMDSEIREAKKLLDNLKNELRDGAK
jgi:hypothetical protein